MRKGYWFSIVVSPFHRLFFCVHLNIRTKKSSISTYGKVRKHENLTELDHFMRSTICSILLLFALFVDIQAQESINVSGAELSGNTGTISYSVGQVVYNTHAMPGASFAEGVQQPYEISTVSGIDIPEIVLQMSTYPNPTTDYLNLSIGNYNQENHNEN